MSGRVGKEATKVFSKTINSPKTAFPMYPNPAAREKPFLKKCTSGEWLLWLFNVSDLYKWQLKERASSDYAQWITHDGPPYANGDLHMGHFENKVSHHPSLFPSRFSRILSTGTSCFQGILARRDRV